MAGNDQGNGIPPERLSDGAGCSRPAERPRDLAIGSRFARRDLPCGCVHSAFESAGRGEIDGHASEILNVTRKMLANALDDLGDGTRRRLRSTSAGSALDPTFRGGRSRFGKVKGDDVRRTAATGGLAPGDAAHAERRLKQGVGARDHRRSLAHVRGRAREFSTVRQPRRRCRARGERRQVRKGNVIDLVRYTLRQALSRCPQSSGFDGAKPFGPEHARSGRASRSSNDCLASAMAGLGSMIAVRSRG